MKKSLFIKSLLIIGLLTFAAPSMAAPVADKNITETPEERAAYLHRRLEEIKGMDIKSMSRSERKTLRVEVRAIKKEMTQLRGGIYISAGVLLIVLLLILLL